MKHTGVALALGTCVVVGVVILVMPKGPETVIRSLLDYFLMLVIFFGLSGLIAASGWAYGTAKRGANAHKATNETQRITERVIERHTLDGRVPHAPQVLPVPGMFDAYPAAFGAEVHGAAIDHRYQRELAQPEQPDLLESPAVGQDVFDQVNW